MITKFILIVVFDWILDFNQYRREKKIEMLLSVNHRLFFDLPKKTNSNKSKIAIFQTNINGCEINYTVIAGYDTGDDEFKDLCREALKEDYNFSYTDRSKKKAESRSGICN